MSTCTMSTCTMSKYQNVNTEDTNTDDVNTQNINTQDVNTDKILSNYRLFHICTIVVYIYYIWIVECTVDCWCYSFPPMLLFQPLSLMLTPAADALVSAAGFFFCPCCWFAVCNRRCPSNAILASAAVAACPGYRDHPRMLNGLNWKFVGHRWTCWFVLWCVQL